jgi:hypothetical protein
LRVSLRQSLWLTGSRQATRLAFAWQSTSLRRIIVPTALIRSPPPAPSPFRCAPGPLLRIGPSRGCHRRSAHHTRAAGTFVRILAPDAHDEIAPQGAERTPASRLGRRKDEESPRWSLLTSLGPLRVLHLRSESPRLRRHSPALVRVESDEESPRRSARRRRRRVVPRNSNGQVNNQVRYFQFNLSSLKNMEIK